MEMRQPHVKCCTAVQHLIKVSYRGCRIRMAKIVHFPIRSYRLSLKFYTNR